MHSPLHSLRYARHPGPSASSAVSISFGRPGIVRPFGVTLLLAVLGLAVSHLSAQPAGDISRANLISENRQGEVREQIANRETVWVQLHTLRGHDSWVYRVRFSPDGKLVASGGDRARAVVWDAHSGDHVTEFMADTSRVRGLAFSPDGKRIVAGGSARRAAVWDLDTGEELQRYSDPDEWVVSAEFSPDGRYVLLGCRDNTAHLWDLETDRKVRQFEGHTSYVNEAIFSLDGSKVITAGSDNTVRVWETATGEEVLRVDEHEDFIRAVAVFSDNGEKVLSVDATGMGLVWDLESGEEIRRFNHGERINAVAVSPDGRFSLIGGRDGVASLRHLATGEELHVFESHDRSVYAVAISPGGGRVLTAARDGEVHLWKAIRPEDFRDWTDRDGRVMKAAYVNLIDDVVTVLRPNGEGFQIPLPTLSEMDAAYARWRTEGKKAVAARLLAAAETGAVGELERVLETNASTGGALPEQALFQAVSAGNAQAIDLLLDHGVSASARNNDGGTALAGAVRAKQHAVAARLLKAGASPVEADDSGLSPLAWALVVGDRELVDLLASDDIEIGPKMQQAVAIVQEGSISSIPEHVVRTVAALDNGEDPGREETAKAELLLDGQAPTTAGLLAALKGSPDPRHLRSYCEAGIVGKAIDEEWPQIARLLDGKQDFPLEEIVGCDGLSRAKVAEIRLLVEGDSLSERERAHLEVERAELEISAEALESAISGGEEQVVEQLLVAGAAEEIDLSAEASLWQTVIQTAPASLRERLFDVADLSDEDRLLLKARHIKVSDWK